MAIATVSSRATALPDTPAGRSYHDATPNEGWFPPVGVPRPAVASAASVIGEDERIQIPDTTVFPFSAIAYLELFNDANEVFAVCSGTFVGPDALLTAGHCLWDNTRGTWNAKRIRVIPAKEEAFEPFGSEFATDWWVPDGFLETGGSIDFDWGLIRLPDVRLTLDTSWLAVAVLPTAALRDPEFTPAIVGYPVDKPAQTMWGQARRAFTAVEAYRLFYDIDTSAGQSGSAIWSLSPGRTLGYVVGIHTQGSGGTGDNSGSRIDRELLDDLRAGCAVMGCTIDSIIDGEPATPSPTPQPPATPKPTAPPGPRPFRAVAPALARD
ncbi:MAG: trypsin-like peptidase domain-containing protein [Anaerolineaceae bacterium]